VKFAANFERLVLAAVSSYNRARVPEVVRHTYVRLPGDASAAISPLKRARLRGQTALVYPGPCRLICYVMCFGK
jgi:hypothetical protein